MRILAALLLSLVLAACGSSTPAAEDGSDGSASGSDTVTESTGETADLGFEATTLSGDTYDGTTLEDRPAVLWFWAPWCPTCRAQIPNLTDLAAQHGDDVEFVGVGGLADEAEIADTAGDIDHLTHLVDPEGAVWSHFGVTSQSTYTVVDADGKVVAEGYLADGELNAIVGDLAQG